MVRVASLLIGYLIGCIQTAYIMGRLVAKIDIRDHGSGNAGTTNVTRVLGSKAGVTVFIIDILKAVVAFFICALIFHGTSSLSGSKDNLIPGMYAGIGVILGHNYPFYLKFKGGKGSASGLGVILCVNFWIALISYAVGITIVALTRYISLASLLITATFFLSLIIFQYPLEIVLLALLMVSISVYQHRTNIGRLTRGEESKFTFKPKIDRKIFKK